MECYREKLKQKNINEKKISELKSGYFKSFETESFNDFKQNFNASVSDIKLYIEVISSIFSLIKIFS